MPDRPTAAEPTPPTWLATAVATAPSGPCPRCGGSGQLRTDRGTYRSCLHCAARGIVPLSA